MGCDALGLSHAVPDDEIATLLPTNVGAPIGRGDAIGSSVRVLAAVACLAMEVSDSATLCDGCNQLPLVGRIKTGVKGRAWSSRRWYLCGNFHRTGVAGRSGHLHRSDLRRSPYGHKCRSSRNAVARAALAYTLTRQR